MNTKKKRKKTKTPVVLNPGLEKMRESQRQAGFQSFRPSKNFKPFQAKSGIRGDR